MNTSFRYPIISLSKTKDPREFILFWRDKFSYPLMDLYYRNINRNRLYRNHLEELFRWKNGMELSTAKTKSWENIAEKLPIINKLRKNFEKGSFEDTFSEVSIIWKIFLLHICSPDSYPIFDQHVYRSYRFIVGESTVLIKSKDLEAFYHEKYVPFFVRLHAQSNGCSTKDIDNALWAYGRLIKSHPFLAL